MKRTTFEWQRTTYGEWCMVEIALPGVDLIHTRLGSLKKVAKRTRNQRAFKREKHTVMRYW